jgi:flagellar M-ring protein FliF
MNELFNQFRTIWDGMEPTRRMILVGVMAGLIIFLFILVRFMGQPQYELLYGDLTQAEQDEYIGKLVEMNIPYKKVGNGLHTPKPAEVRARLLETGFVKGGVMGWTIFDKTGLGSTNFQNNVAYQRALQDEVRRTLREMQGVNDAQVILTLPRTEETIFADEKVEPTASVMLKLSSPNAISQDKVVAITNWVAGSVKGMKPEKVTVVDNYLNDLTAGLRNKGMTINGRQIGDPFSMRIAFEQEMEKSIESMLNRVMGPNKAVARVNADLDLDYQEIKSETFGERGVPRSESERTELQQGRSDVPSGVPGTDSNLTEYRTEDSSASESRSEKTERTVNYEIDRKEEFRIKAPGTVRRLTVSLFVDGNLAPAEIRQMEASVANAVGLDETRGDRLTVSGLPFKQVDPFQDIPTERKMPWEYLVRLGVLVGAIVILLVFFFSLIRSTPGVMKTAGGHVDTMVGATSSEIAAAHEQSPEERHRMERQESLEQFAKDHPEDVAVLLKAWLAED